jgi:hypothetical protein
VDPCKGKALREEDQHTQDVPHLKEATNKG